MRRLCNEIVENHVSAKKGIVLSGDYKNNKSVFRVKCHLNHEWDTKWVTLQRGAWCPTCSQNAKKIPKIQREDILKLVNSFNYELLTSGKLTRLSRIKVKCYKHHFVWETCYGNLK